MGASKGYVFRVFSHSAETYSISDTYTYQLSADFKKRAVTAGLIGGILFFIVAIVLSVCTVKICNKRRRRKQERGKIDRTRSGCLIIERCLCFCPFLLPALPMT